MNIQLIKGKDVSEGDRLILSTREFGAIAVGTVLEIFRDGMMTNGLGVTVDFGRFNVQNIVIYDEYTYVVVIND